MRLKKLDPDVRNHLEWLAGRREGLQMQLSELERVISELMGALREQGYDVRLGDE